MELVETLRFTTGQTTATSALLATFRHPTEPQLATRARLVQFRHQERLSAALALLVTTAAVVCELPATLENTVAGIAPVETAMLVTCAPEGRIA